MEPVFEAADLKKEYDEGSVQALRGVNFQIYDGEFVAIIGQSGSGKSTLLHLLGALDKPSSGKLNFRGASLPDRKDLSTYRARDIGYIFQAFHLLPTFTAFENVQLPMFETESSASAREKRARELLEAVGLQHRLDHLPSKLSGGERQRVAIARSLANAPSVLLADEPTGNLDSENARQILELLTKLQNERKMTLVLVTHDLTIAHRATRALQVLDGRLVFDGPSANLTSTSLP